MLAQSSKLMQGIAFDFPLNINHRKKKILAFFIVTSQSRCLGKQALSDGLDLLVSNRAFSHDVSTAAVLVLQNNNGGHVGIPNKSCGS